MSTSLILVNLSGLAAVAAGLLASCERPKSVIHATLGTVTPGLVLRNDVLGQHDQHAPSGAGSPRTARRVGPITERLNRSRDPIHRYREVTGRHARVRWWQRVRALVLLGVIVMALGMLVAALVGIAFLAGTILLETVS